MAFAGSTPLTGSLTLGFDLCRPTCLRFQRRPWGVKPHLVIRTTSVAFLSIWVAAPPLINPSVIVSNIPPTAVSPRFNIGPLIKGCGLILN